MNSYTEYTKDAEAFEQTAECKNFLRIWEEVGKAWEAVEASDEWKAWDAADKINKYRDEEACRLKKAHEHAIEEFNRAKKILHETEQWQDWSKAEKDYALLAEDAPTGEFDKLAKLKKEMENFRRFGCPSYFEMHEAAKDAMWGAYGAYEARLGKIAEDKENTEEAFVNSQIYKDWIITKQALLDADPKRFKQDDEASVAYTKIWEDTGDHDKAISEYYRIVNIDAYKI